MPAAAPRTPAARGQCHARIGSGKRLRHGSARRAQRARAADAEAAAPGAETSGQNFEAVKDIDAIMKALPHRCGSLVCGGSLPLRSPARCPEQAAGRGQLISSHGL